MTVLIQPLLVYVTKQTFGVGCERKVHTGTDVCTIFFSCIKKLFLFFQGYIVNIKGGQMNLMITRYGFIIVSGKLKEYLYNYIYKKEFLTITELLYY